MTADAAVSVPGGAHGAEFDHMDAFRILHYTLTTPVDATGNDLLPPFEGDAGRGEADY